MLKLNENIRLILPINILLTMLESVIFVWYPGSYTHLNTTIAENVWLRASAFSPHGNYHFT